MSNDRKASESGGARRRPWTRRVLAAAIGLLLAVVGLELGALGWVAMRHGRLFHALPAPDDGPVVTTFDKAQAIHPFWASAPRPGSPVFPPKMDARLETMILGPDKRPEWTGSAYDNCGFAGNPDLPFAREGDEFLVGIVGGSVAKFLGLIGRDRLRETLASSPRLGGRTVRIVNLARSGAKQPQQVNIAAYVLGIGQPLDLLVNLDGFNEAALSHVNWRKGIDPSFPRDYPRGFARLVRRPDRQSIAWQSAVLDHDERLLSLDGWRDQRVSAGLHLLAAALRPGVESSLDDLLRDALAVDDGALEVFASAITTQGLDQDGVEDRIVDLWARSSLTLHGLAAAHDVEYLHVLQPNQYATDRVFDADERKIALVDDHPYARGVARLYPRMRARLADLRERGVAVFDATDALDDEPRRVYADACCHYTDLGNEILAAAIGDAILRLAAPD